MDISSLLGTLLSKDSVDQISQTSNVPAGGVQSVLSSALPSLLDGALAQSNGSDTSEGFAGALTQHSAADTSNIASFLSGVDLEDGAKIVGHLLGSDSSAVMQKAADESGVSRASTSNILSQAAPLLMSLLGQQTGAQQQEQSSGGIGDIMGSLLSNVDVGSLLSGLLGATSTDTSSTTGTGKKKKKKKKAGSSGSSESSGGFLSGLLNLFK